MEETTETTTTNPKQGGGTRIIIAAILLIAIGIGGYIYLSKDKNSSTGEDTATSTADIVLGTDRESGPVAQVNGAEVSRKEYEDSVVNIAENAKAQGADITDPAVQEQIKEQALTTLINTKLLAQAATASGVSITDTEIQTEFDGIVAQFGSTEALQAQLASYNISEEALRSDLKEQLTIQAYLETAVDTSTITVTDEEITAFYDSLDNSQGTLPELETIRDQVEAEIRTQKEQVLIAELLDTLREQATIEKFV